MNHLEIQEMKFKKRRFGRCNFFVKKTLQIHFVATTSLLLSTLGVWAATTWIYHRCMTEGWVGVGLGVKLLLNGPYVMRTFLVADVIELALLSLCFSQYIAGPVRRMTRSAVEWMGQPARA